MFKKIVSTAFVTLALALVSPALAQSPSIEFNFLKIEGLTVGARFSLDDGFEQEAGRTINTRLEMILPTAKGKYRILVDNQPPGGAVKINFATDDLVLIDSIHIIEATIPMAPMAERLKIFAGLLKNDVFPMTMDGMADGNLLALRNYTMGRYQTVEMIATFTDPTLGPMYLRVLGVPHPDKAESIFIINNINASLEPLDELDQFPQTLSGRAMDTIVFTE